MDTIEEIINKKIKKNFVNHNKFEVVIEPKIPLDIVEYEKKLDSAQIVYISTLPFVSKIYEKE